MNREVIETQDGSKTIFLPELDETYHSTFGAITESQHVFINNGIKLVNKKAISVLEIGFGTGLNAFLTILYTVENRINLYYHTVEKFPLPFELVDELAFTNNENKNLFEDLHKAEWEKEIEMSDNVRIFKSKLDILTELIVSKHEFDIIYFDAFAPSKQPEMWTEDVFNKLINLLNENGMLVTYSASGVVKRALRGVGFFVKRYKGPPGKHHMLVAKKEI